MHRIYKKYSDIGAEITMKETLYRLGSGYVRNIDIILNNDIYEFYKLSLEYEIIIFWKTSIFNCLTKYIHACNISTCTHS